jgi:hypothetical protein
MVGRGDVQPGTLMVRCGAEGEASDHEGSRYSSFTGTV